MGSVIMLADPILNNRIQQKLGKEALCICNSVSKLFHITQNPTVSTAVEVEVPFIPTFETVVGPVTMILLSLPRMHAYALNMHK